MYGLGVLKGLWVTIKNFTLSYFTRKRLTTVQYPEERITLSEHARTFPILVYDESPDKLRCVACEICAKECPPKCISIVRAQDEAGKPLKQPKFFDIDYSVCMNCGICEEVCPFDSIYMYRQFELSAYGRSEEFLYTKNRLAKSAEYFSKIRPETAKKVEEKRKAKEK